MKDFATWYFTWPVLALTALSCVTAWRWARYPRRFYIFLGINTAFCVTMLFMRWFA